VPLLKNVQRLTAPNPGVMTGPGTNSYLVGDPATGYIAIDPGPADTEHLDKLWRAAGGDIRMIVCTHSHPDHSPGAAPLQAMCVRAGRAAPPILGLPSAPTARAASQFTPDRSLQDNELLTLAGQGPDGEITHTLQVIHTPGHAADHVCFLLEDERLLLAGDQVLEGATAVIAPPHGHMGQYLAALPRLQALHLAAIAPAHGRVLCEPGRLLAAIVTHRRQREAKVLAALQRAGQGTPETLVAEVYADTPAFLQLAARLSLQAHRVHLVEDGQARFENGVWHAPVEP